jgi:hypothetical protein
MRQVTIVIDARPVQIFDTFNPVNEKHAVQVINLVVNHHRVKAPKDALKGLAPFIQAGYTQEMRAYRFGVKAGEAETAIKISLLVASLSYLRVDQRNGRTRLPLSIASSAQSNHYDPAMNVNLRGGQPNSLRLTC